MKKKVIKIQNAQERTLSNIKRFQNETQEIADVLTHGIAKILTRIAHEPENGFWRQMAVRVLFSQIESMSYRMKQLILLSKDFSKFKPGEIACLEEKSYRVDGKGEVKERNAYPSTKGNVSFVFRMMARLVKSDFEITNEDEGWKSYQKAVEIRNRITHPKKLSDLEISQKDYEIAGNAYHWFVKCHNQLIKQSREYFQSKLIS